MVCSIIFFCLYCRFNGHNENGAPTTNRTFGTTASTRMKMTSVKKTVISEKTTTAAINNKNQNNECTTQLLPAGNNTNTNNDPDVIPGSTKIN